ncbi:element excision factor XisI family protein [Thiothrix eikelboomii]|uniref:element excision factor XisI family protein n=1 Tax=Thiothrix eikelboomii TaxID=92487 RepID=UPI003BAF984F
MAEELMHYQQSIKQLLKEYSELQDPEAELQLVFDDERQRYLALWVGWSGHKRVHQCVIHIEISPQGWVVIQRNDTEELIDQRLIELGIPKERIYLGMIPALYQERVA